MTRSHRSDGRHSRRTFLQGTAAAGGALALTGNISELKTSSVLAQDMARNETLYVGGWDFSPAVTFTPITGNPPWPVDPRFQYVFESLFAYDQLTGTLLPALANDIQWPDEATAVVTLQAGTAFSDGTPLTSEDVVYTYDLPRRHEGLYYSDVVDYVSSVEATDDRTVTFNLNPELLNPLIFNQHLRSNLILPKHIWEEREAGDEALIDFIDLDPVGSGPYRVIDASTERTVIELIPEYWGATALGLPVPKFIIHPILDSNDSANLAFSRGEIDLSQTFLPQVWQLWEEDDEPVGTWYREEPYHLPGSIPLLFINLSLKPFDDPLVRRALAYSINYPHIAATAMSRYSVPANASLVVPEGGEAKFFNAEQVAAEGWTYDPDEAVRILEEEVGAVKDGDVYSLPDGTRFGPFTVHCPFGWTDWQTAIELVAQSANEVGFEIRTDFPEQPVVTSRNQAGDFDLAIWYVAGAGPASPWLRFRDVLDNRGVAALGEPAFWNYNRYQNDEVSEILDAVPLATEEELVELYAQLDAIFRQDIPAIPLMYRPEEFYEYIESSWTGFANSENPTSPPAQADAGIKLLYGLSPVASE